MKTLLFVCCWLVLLTTACSNDETPDAAQAVEAQASGESVKTRGMDEQSNSSLVEAAQDAADEYEFEGPGADPIDEYDRRCPVENDDQSLECDWLHALVVVEVVEALEAVERARDQRGTEVAIEALGLPGEPEILVAACRILGRFPDTPGIGQKLLPLLLDSPYLEVQHMAAEVLGRVPDPDMNGVAQQWLDHHRELRSSDPFFALPEMPAHYAGMGFPVIPDGQRFTPADSDRSVGWWTSESPAAVSARMGEAVGTDPLDYLQWTERAQMEMMNIVGSIDQSKVTEMEQLSEQYSKNLDPALLERIQKLQEEIYAPMQSFGEDADKAVSDVLYPGSSSDGQGVYYFVAEERAGRPSRVILIYPQSGINRTVVQMGWDLRDYPPAWGEEPR